MDINSVIEKEGNYEERKLLHSVYLNNAIYVKSKPEKERFLEIIKAMIEIDRKDFVLEADKESAYVDVPLAIGYGQTISQPTTVARMLLLADLKKGLNVLEVGSGSGWNATLLAYLVKPGKVISVERIKELSALAKKNFKATKKKLNLKFVHGSALDRKSKIWKEKYDRIISTAAASADLIKDLKEVVKLNENGLLVFPTEEGNLEVWQSKKGFLERIYFESGYSFVPLIK